MGQEMGENNCSVVAYPPVKFTIKKEFDDPEELEMEEQKGEDEGEVSAKTNGEMMHVNGELNERSVHSSLMDDVETICKSPDKEAQLKEKEENQHPLAYAPVKFKQYIKQEPKDEEAHCQSNVSQDFIQEDGKSTEGSNHSSLDGVETTDESSDEEPQLKENEEIQHPLAYAPVKFKEYIKQEPEDEEAYCQSNVTEDLIQEDGKSTEGINHSPLDGVETTVESSDEEPPLRRSLRTRPTAVPSTKGKMMKRASKTSSHLNKKGTDEKLQPRRSLRTRHTAVPSTKGKMMKQASYTSNKPNQKENSVTRRPTVIEGPFKCDKCEHSFKSDFYLKHHLRRVCENEPSFLCKQCGSRFKRKCHLKVHLVGVHKVDHSQLSKFGAAPYQRPIMPFKCHKCERTYKVKWSLQAHLIQKCGAVRAYACTLCDHRTVTKGNLRVHLCNTHDIDPSKLVSHGAGFDVLP